MSQKVMILNGQDWDQEVLQSPEPVLVDFWAEWCAPCRRLAPVIDTLAQEYAGRVKVAKLNVDENPELAARYGVFSIPTLVLFQGGQPVQRRLGAQPVEELRRLMESRVEQKVAAGS